jgi:predicted RNase H-like HicB family nuclease
MIQEYLHNSLGRATYEIIDDGKRFYAEIKDLRGVWATGRTLEECRKNLMTTIEGWLIIRLRKNLPIPHFKMPSLKIATRKYA